MESLLSTQPFCLVLSGGGTKGVYHIGVWRALRELNIPVNAFIGASIGAVVAAFLAQGKDAELEEFGRTIEVDNVLNLPPELLREGMLSLKSESVSGVLKLLRQFVENKGLDTSPFRRLISEHINESAIRASGNDLGIMTMNLSSLEPEEVYIEQMHPGTLIDYLMASSAFPGFENPQIEGKRYVDGGVYDNIPYEMARKRGYRRIIISDVSGIGRNRQPKIEDSITIYIKNSLDMGSVFDFDREFLDKYRQLGYLDTMRLFGRYFGYRYFLKPGTAGLECLQPSENSQSQSANASICSVGHKRLPEYMRHERNRDLAAMECAAMILGVERLRVYTLDEFSELITERRHAVDMRIAQLKAGSERSLRNLAPVLRQTIARREFIECPYYYCRLIDEVFPSSAASVLRKALERLNAELPAGIAWLDAHAQPPLS